MQDYKQELVRDIQEWIDSPSGMVPDSTFHSATALFIRVLRELGPKVGQMVNDAYGCRAPGEYAPPEGYVATTPESIKVPSEF